MSKQTSRERSDAHLCHKVQICSQLWDLECCVNPFWSCREARVMGHPLAPLLVDLQNMQKRISEHISEQVQQGMCTKQITLSLEAKLGCAQQTARPGRFAAQRCAPPARPTPDRGYHCMYNLNLSYLSFIEFLNRFEASLSLFLYMLHPENLLTSFDVFSISN